MAKTTGCLSYHYRVPHKWSRSYQLVCCQFCIGVIWPDFPLTASHMHERVKMMAMEYAQGLMYVRAATNVGTLQ